MKQETRKEKGKGKNLLSKIIFGFILAIFAALALGPVIGQFQKKENYNQVLNYGCFGNFVVLTDSMEPLYQKGDALVTKKQNADSLYSLYLSYEEKNAELKQEYYQKLKEVSNNFSPTADNMENVITYLNEYEEKAYHIDLTFVDCYEEYQSIRPTKENDPITSFLDVPIQLTTSTLESRIMTHRLREIQVNESVKTGEGRYTFIVSGINIGGNQSGLGQYQAFTEKQLLGKVELNSSFLGKFFRFLASPWGLLIMLLIPSGYLIVTSIMDIFKALDAKDREETVTENEEPKNPVAQRVEFKDMSDEDRERLKQEMLQQMLEEKSGKK